MTYAGFVLYDSSYSPQTLTSPQSSELSCCSLHSGPAFIKWAQWSSSRPDLFPPDLCQRFERLQTAAPSHSAHESMSAVQAAFREVEEAGGGREHGGALFESFEADPVASGSIAQVTHTGSQRVLPVTSVCHELYILNNNYLNPLGVKRIHVDVIQSLLPLRTHPPCLNLIIRCIGPRSLHTGHG